MNLRALGVAVVTLAAGLFLFRYVTGPVRGLLGDVLIIVLGVSALAGARLGTPRLRIGGMVALGVVAEAVQALDLVGPDSHWLLHLTVGSTADPLDLLAYGTGGMISWVAERWWITPGSATPGAPPARRPG